MDKYFKQSLKYFSKNPEFNAIVHALGGIGLGVLLANPLAGSHPVRWGIAFLLISLLGHLWTMKK